MQDFLNIIFIGLLIVVSVHDIRRMQISDGLNGLILLTGVIKLVWIAASGGWETFVGVGMDSLLGLFIVSVPLALIAVVTKGAIGGGDIKLVGACGFYVGSQAVLHGTMVGFFFGGLYAAVQLLISGRRSRRQIAQSYFALGPFLCVGMVIALVMYINSV